MITVSLETKQTEVIGKFTFEINTEKLTLLIKEEGKRFRFGYKVWYNYRFKSIQSLQDFKSNFLAQQAKNEAEKKERQNKKKELQQQPNPCKIGDIFYESWGYEQTNIQFYEVIEVVGKSVRIRELQQNANYDHGYMSGTTEPKKGEFLDNSEPVLKRVLWSTWQREDRPNHYLKSRFGWCSPYDGVPKSYSCYA